MTRVWVDRGSYATFGKRDFSGRNRVIVLDDLNN